RPPGDSSGRPSRRSPRSPSRRCRPRRLVAPRDGTDALAWASSEQSPRVPQRLPAGSCPRWPAASFLCMISWALVASLLALAPPEPVPTPRGNHATGDAPRGNTVLTRRRGVVLAVAAVPRLAVLLGDGAGVIQPVGFGAALEVRVYALRLGRLRFGGQAHLGHTRVLERVILQHDDGTGTTTAVRRHAALGHTDFSLGPSAQVVLGPIIIEGGAAVGLGISNLVRPLGPLPSDEV